MVVIVSFSCSVVDVVWLMTLLFVLVLVLYFRLFNCASLVVDWFGLCFPRFWWYFGVSLLDVQGMGKIDSVMAPRWAGSRWKKPSLVVLYGLTCLSIHSPWDVLVAMVLLWVVVVWSLVVEGAIVCWPYTLDDVVVAGYSVCSLLCLSFLKYYSVVFCYLLMIVGLL